MTTQRPRRAGPGSSGLLGAALLAATLAGCASATTSAPAASTAAAAAAAAAAPQLGCASVNQATAVTIQQTMHAVDPTRNRTAGTVYRQSPQVQALFGQLCAAVTHPATATLLHCPLEIGTTYYGTFYDGTRSLATFSYAASGCQRVSVTAAGKTMNTMVSGRAAAAAPHLSADLDVLMETKPGVTQPAGTVSPGTVNPGTVSPGTVSPGTVSPGTVNPGGTMDPTQP